MTVQKNGELLDVTQLSSGEKSLLTLVSDLARRLSIANPESANPRLEEGIVLIDEVDLHLHPRWQRMLLPSLERTFPKCQFIVTTHSPQVISEVKPECIYLLERKDGETLAKRPEASFGLDSNRILEDLMGVDERPSRIKEQLTEFFRLIDEGKLDEAKALRRELEAEIGSDEPNFAKGEVLIPLMPGCREFFVFDSAGGIRPSQERRSAKRASARERVPLRQSFAQTGMTTRPVRAKCARPSPMHGPWSGLIHLRSRPCQPPPASPACRPRPTLWWCTLHTGCTLRGALPRSATKSGEGEDTGPPPTVDSRSKLRDPHFPR